MSLPASLAGVRRLLAAFERRLLSLLLLYGVGRALATLTLLTLALYALDRAFEPPVYFRLLLLALAVYGLGKVLFRSVYIPLRRRPSSRDLAALLERQHPGMQDLLATAVEADQVAPGESPELKLAAAQRAEAALEQIDLQATAPGGAARRSVFRGVAALALMIALALWQPAEARIFVDRLFGGPTPWPRATTLVLLAPYANGEELEFEQITPELARLQVAQGTTLTLRVRAQGRVPEQVVAEGPRGARPMQARGDGEFVLRLSALTGAERWSFRGGDDDDGTPLLELVPGYAPAIRDWLVSIQPPAYTGRDARQSGAHEFRVPQGSEVSAEFTVDRDVAEALLRRLDGSTEPLTATEGRFQFAVDAQESGEAVVELVGVDGFRDGAAAVLRWQAEPDSKPSARFVFPSGAWSTIPGSELPLVVEASDDYGLGEAQLLDHPDADPVVLELGSNRREFESVHTVTIPEPSAETFGADFRLRYLLRVSDGAEPLPQRVEAKSAWVDVLSTASFEQQLGERMVRVRERIEDLRQGMQPVLSGEAGSRLTPLARRVDRELESLTLELEKALLERIFAKLDRGAAAAVPTARELILQPARAAGEVAERLSESGAAPLLDRSALLRDLARDLHGIAGKEARDFRAVTLAGEDAAQAALELDQALQAVLDDLLAWEDFQSAVDLLRGMLDRQRTLYLRTQEASGR